MFNPYYLVNNHFLHYIFLLKYHIINLILKVFQYNRKSYLLQFLKIKHLNPSTNYFIHKFIYIITLFIKNYFITYI